jgi:hypothetical protein
MSIACRNVTKKVFKYRLYLTDEPQTFEVPQVDRNRTQVPLVAVDPKGDLCVWIVAHEGCSTVKRRFVVEGTGHLIFNECGYTDHVGSAVMGPFVWHVFEILDLHLD